MAIAGSRIATGHDLATAAAARSVRLQPDLAVGP
jgi:hypothetical protein